jgi:16S rRNA (guanine527-N7)-methyltransferase
MDEPSPPSTNLAEALVQHELELDPDVAAKVDAYRQTLWDWNEKINLTRHTTFDKFVSRDLVDTMQLAAHIEPNQRVLDIGSGGGVPGLLLAIVRPDLRVGVSDSVAKKAKVLESMVASLQLPVTVYPARAEQVLELSTWNTLTARGVAPLRKLLTWLEPHWDAFDRLLLIKGKSWANERGEARHYGLLRGKQLRCLANYSARGAGESVVLGVSRVAEEP